MDYKLVTDFVHALYGTPDFVPLSVPRFAGKEKEYLEECIDSTFVSSVGPFVDRFEAEMAAYTGAARAVVTVNGTEALHVALMLSGVEREDEVLTQPLTFIATCNAISYLGAFPVFIDVERATLGMSPDALESWLEAHAELRGEACYNRGSGRRIKACVPMHTFGHPVRIDRISEICRRWGIALVEDAAESVGSTFKGQHTGTFAPIGALSFNGNKTITTGGGGMLLFQDAELGAKAKHLTTQAKVPHRWEFRHDSIGFNYRMPNINAALGCAQLEQLDGFIESKRAVAAAYKAFFAGIEGMEFFTEPEGCRSNYWLNAVLLPSRKERDAFLEFTNDHGVMTRPVWELMPDLPMFRGCESDGIPTARALADSIVNIPSSARI